MTKSSSSTAPSRKAVAKKTAPNKTAPGERHVRRPKKKAKDGSWTELRDGMRIDWDLPITLPDGSQRQFENPVSVMDVAADIGPGLAKATLAVYHGNFNVAR